jgi:hypothetical protein
MLLPQTTRETGAMAAQFELFLNIPQAARSLKVTTKTIRNYIDRELLPAEKWNGAWRIREHDVMEMYYKKYGTIMEPSGPEETRTEGEMRVPMEEWEELQRRLGGLEAAERLIENQRAEIRRAGDRIAQLEASSASAWTESRNLRQQVDVLTASVTKLESVKETTTLEKTALSMDLDRCRRDLESAQTRLVALAKTNEDLVEELKDKTRELEAAELKLRELEKKDQRSASVRSTASAIRQWICGLFGKDRREARDPEREP